MAEDAALQLPQTHLYQQTGNRHFTTLSAKCSQYPKGVFKVFGGASIGFASHKTTAQKADYSQMYHPAFYNE